MNREEAKRVISREVCIARICSLACSSFFLFISFPRFSIISNAPKYSLAKVADALKEYLAPIMGNSCASL